MNRMVIRHSRRQRRQSCTPHYHSYLYLHHCKSAIFLLMIVGTAGGSLVITIVSSRLMVLLLRLTICVDIMGLL